MDNRSPIADLIGGSTRSGSGTARKALAALIGTNRDARELFLGPDGKFKPAATRFFAAMSKEAGLNKVGEFQPDARLQDHMLGRQYIVRRMAALIDLDVARLEFLQRQLGDDR